RTWPPTTPTSKRTDPQPKCCATGWPSVTTMQLDVFPNPLVRARPAYPFVVVLQADIAAFGRERIIAFLAPRAQLGPVAGRLMPVVEIDGRQFVLLMPSITNLPSHELRGHVANLHAWRDRIVEAIDWTFLGV